MTTPTMRALAALLAAACCLAPGARAAPAIVWSRRGENAPAPTLVNSDAIPTDRLLRDLLAEGAAPEGRSVIFFLGRGADDGAELLSKLSAGGALPGVAAQYDRARVHHTHVSGLDSVATLMAAADKAGAGAAQVSLTELRGLLQDPTALNGPTKRARALAAATVWMVPVDAAVDPAQLDAAATAAIEDAAFGQVVLAAQRSVDEVKMERGAFAHRRVQIMQEAARQLLGGAASASAGHRRLEDVAQGDDAANNNNNNNGAQGIYYVNMTPNIFAGILFTLFFAVVTALAVSCMGMIAGQDVYVSKMPAVGREA